MKYLMYILLLGLVACGPSGGDNLDSSGSQDVIKIWSAAIVEQGGQHQIHEGKLFSSLAIGGENTGYSLYLGGSKPPIELDLATNGLEKEYAEYLFVEVHGSFKEIQGTEIHSRIVFEVTRIFEPDKPHID
jgi:hypothetical protein